MGQHSAVLTKVRDGNRVFSCMQNAETLRLYTETGVPGSKFACIDVYADGTTLLQSGTHSACVVRMRVANVDGQSNAWHEVGIAPVVVASTRK